ncbi:hypothetical protein [Salipiger sp.]|uniref:hypothetical protein n=1 Tax=Salipiger sp. TaxID=2078585 RepID=UPI003A974E35
MSATDMEWMWAPLTNARKEVLHKIIDQMPAKFGGNGGKTGTVYPATNAACKQLIENARNDGRAGREKVPASQVSVHSSRQEPAQRPAFEGGLTASEVNNWLATLPEGEPDV